MTDMNKTKKQLVTELAKARRQIKEWEKSESERKQVKKELGESQHFIDYVLDSIQDGISVLAPDMTIRLVNNLMKEWYAENLPLEGKKCYEVYQNRNRPCDPCPTLRCLKSGKTERNIVPGLPGSAVEWVELFSYPMKDPETGKINGAVEFVRNITARKKAEEGLKESKELFSAFMDYLPAIVFVKDEESRTKFMNKHMRDVLGADDSWIDHTVLEIFGDTDLARKMMEDDIKALSAGFESKEESVHRADGTERLYETQKFRIGRKDKPPLLGGISLDITERKQAEEALRKSEGKYRLLSESSQDGIYIIGTEGFEYINSAFIKILGYKAKEIFSKDFNFLDTIHPEDKKLIEERKEVRNKGKKLPSMYTFRIITKSGKTKHVEVNTAPLPGEGIHILGILRDITKQKQSEILLMAERNLGLNLSKTSSLKETLNFCLETAINVSEMDSGGIYLVDEKSGDIDLAVHKGLPSDFIKSTLHHSADSDNARFIKKGKLIYSRHEKIDINKDNVRIKEGLKAVAILPVFHKKKIVACLNVASHILNEVPKLSRTALQGIASLIGAAIIQAEMEEQVQISEQKYRSIFNNTGTATAIIEADMTMSLVNSEMEKLTGFSKKEIEGKKKWTDFCSKEDLARMKKYHASRRTGGGEAPKRYEARMVNRAGEVRQGLLIIDMIPGTEQSVISLLDITDSKRAEERLRTNEAQLSNAMVIAKLGYCEYDVESDLFTFNDHFYNIFRTTAEKVGGYKMSPAKYAKQFVHPDDMAVVANEMKKAMETTDPNFSRTLEHRIIYADGEPGYISVRFFVVKDSQGHTIKIYGANQDISKRKIMENELRDSETRYHYLFENSSEFLFTLDLKGNFTDVNKAAEIITGYTKSELLTKNFKDYTPKKDHEKLFRAFSNIYKTGEVLRDFPIEAKIKDNSVKYFETSFSQLRKDDQIIGYQGSSKDITERKQAEEELAKLASIAKYSSELVNLANMDGKMIFLNEAGGKMLGIEPDEVEQINIMEVIPDHFKEMVQTELVPTLMQGKTWEGELQYQNIKTGKLIDVYAKTFPVMDPNTGEPQFLSNVSEDITARKKTEKKIKASLKEKEVLLQEIHHRVKNNMQIIVSLLRLQSFAAKDKKIEDMFKVAQDRIRSMAIIHEKLYQSKDFAEINFFHYIKSLTMHLMQTYQIDPKQITLKTDVKDVHLDINQGVPVGLLLNELVSNALKHAFPKGKKGEIIVKFYADKKGKKTLIVSDNGIGHPDKVDISKPETLGMQLIKDLTKQIGGKLALVNKAGTTIKITFS